MAVHDLRMAGRNDGYIRFGDGLYVPSKNGIPNLAAQLGNFTWVDLCTAETIGGLGGMARNSDDAAITTGSDPDGTKIGRIQNAGTGSSLTDRDTDRPSLVNAFAGMNNRMVAKFDDDNRDQGMWSTAGTTTSQPFTLVWSGHTAAPTGNNRVVYDTPSISNRALLSRGAAGNYFMWAGSGAGAGSVVIGASTNGATTLVVVFNGAGSKAWMNGVEVDVSSFGGPQSITQPVIGANFNQSGVVDYDGDYHFGFLGRIDGDASGADLDNLNLALGEYYGSHNEIVAL